MPSNIGSHRLRMQLGGKKPREGLCCGANPVKSNTICFLPDFWIV